jgi:hypothetical protein
MPNLKYPRRYEMKAQVQKYPSDVLLSGMYEASNFCQCLQGRIWQNVIV